MLTALRLSLVAAVAGFGLLTLACGDGGSTVSGEVRFVRDVDLPDDATVTVQLLDTSLADASAIELGEDVIENADRLPVRFRIEYDPGQIEERNGYSLQARVELGDELLYINDTVHPVLTGGAPRNSDVAVISINPFDQCVEPLPGEIHSSFADLELPDDAVLHVRLWDISEPEERFVVTEASFDDLDEFPIEFELPYEGVQINRHHRYELEAEIWFDGELQFHIPNAEWRRTILPHCPNDDLMLVNDVFPVSEFPAE